jgi:hypothetical protein
MKTNTTKPKSILELLNEKRADKIPEGWLNLTELANREDANPLSSSFREMVNQAVKAGILQRRQFRAVVKVGDGSALRSVAYYKRNL